MQATSNKNTQLHAFGLHKLKLAICPKTCFRQTLCFRHIQSRKIQGIYFKIQGTYFKIYALYFLRSAFFFFRLQIWRFLQWEFSCFLRSFLIFFALNFKLFSIANENSHVQIECMVVSKGFMALQIFVQ